MSNSTASDESTHWNFERLAATRAGALRLAHFLHSWQKQADVLLRKDLEAYS